MTAPTSNDLRERVVAAVLSGESGRAVAARFEVAASSVVKWSQRHRATGSFIQRRWAVIANASWRRNVTSLLSGWLKIRI
jgi:transposase